MPTAAYAARARSLPTATNAEMTNTTLAKHTADSRYYPCTSYPHKSQVESNIVLVRPDTMGPETLAAALAREGVLVLPFGEDVRLVTHHEITENAIEITLKAFYSVLSGASRGP